MFNLHSPHSEPTQSAVVWPLKFLPVEADNFVSNELIVKDVTPQQIWNVLIDINHWRSAAESVISEVAGAQSHSVVGIQKGDSFEYSTVNFPTVRCTVTGVSPPDTRAGRLSWTATGEGFQACHAWIVGAVDGGGVRLLSQQSQFGEEAVRRKRQKPNASLLEQQEFLEAIEERAKKSV